MGVEDSQQLPHSFMSLKEYQEQKCQKACKTIRNYLVKKEKEALPYFLLSSQKGSFLKPCALYMYYSELFPAYIQIFW